MAARKLTPKQERFAQTYVELGNATEAYRIAYDASRMKPETVNREAHARLAHPKISARVTELRARVLKRHDITADRVLEELAKIAFADLADFVSIEADGAVTIDFAKAAQHDSLGALSEITQESIGGKVIKTKFRFHSKPESLKLLGSYFKMYTEKHEITGGDGGPITLAELVRSVAEDDL